MRKYFLQPIFVRTRYTIKIESTAKTFLFDLVKYSFELLSLQHKYKFVSTLTFEKYFFIGIRIEFYGTHPTTHDDV